MSGDLSQNVGPKKVPDAISVHTSVEGTPIPKAVPRGLWKKICSMGGKARRGIVNARTLVGAALGKGESGIFTLCEKVNRVACGCFSKMKHSVSTNLHIMPIQAVREGFSWSNQVTIPPSDITNYGGTIACDKENPLPDDSNKRGAIRVLASYLEVCGLELVVNNTISEEDPLTGAKLQRKSDYQTLDDQIALTDDQIAVLNGLLSNVFSGEGVSEKHLSQRIHKAFAAVIKTGMSGKDQKDIYNAVEVARGKIGPSVVTNHVEITVEDQRCVIDETLTAAKTSKWANAFYESECDKENDPPPAKDTRPSACKKNPELQTTAMNLHVHKTEVKVGGTSVTKTMIRGGAPCTHGRKPPTEALIKKLEAQLGLSPVDGESTYQRASRLLAEASENSEIIELQKELQKRMDYSTAQMMARLEAAYKESPGDVDKPFIHSEMSFLSPGDKKEKSMLMDAEMAMGNISNNYKLKNDGSGLVKVEQGQLDSLEGTRDIKIILTQMAVNENQVSDDPMQDRINLQACQDLSKIIEGDGSDKAQKARQLIGKIQDRLQDPNRPYADPDIVHWFNEVYEMLEITTGVFCKSGKDRTGQAVSDAVAQQVGRVESLQNSEKIVKRTRSALKRGLSLYVTGANTGKKNGYAFNLFQLSMLPECFRPSRWICNTSAHS